MQRCFLSCSKRAIWGYSSLGTLRRYRLHVQRKAGPSGCFPMATVLMCPLAGGAPLGSVMRAALSYILSREPELFLFSILATKQIRTGRKMKGTKTTRCYPECLREILLAVAALKSYCVYST